MYVVIVGAGEVGSSIAESLTGSHEVVVVDRDGDRVESLTYSLDVLPVEGDGADLATLREAGIDEADLLIASTDDDETNIVTCGTAQIVADPFTIARVRKTKYLDTWNHSQGALGVDFMVGTNRLTAGTIAQVIGLPAARDVATFAAGVVHMAEFAIPDGSPIAGQTIADADRFSSLTFAAIVRNGDVVVPGGDAVIQPDDEVIVIGSRDSVREFAREVAPTEVGASDVLILGGSSIGALTATLLTERGYAPRLVESDPNAPAGWRRTSPGRRSSSTTPRTRRFSNANTSTGSTSSWPRSTATSATWWPDCWRSAWARTVRWPSSRTPRTSTSSRRSASTSR